MTLELIAPSLARLPLYADALRRGWSPDNIRPAQTARGHLQAIEQDPGAFVDGLEDPQARGGPITLPDGALAERLPGFQRWLWDGDFCGSMGFRWQPGGGELPGYVLGHIGYSVVPWKQGLGYATRALGLLLPELRAMGMPFVQLTTEPDNIASQKVILANGGWLVERFVKLAAYGGGAALRFQIDLQDPPT